MITDLDRLRQEAQRQQRHGAVTADLKLPDNVRKGIPPPGIAYSANFARCQRFGAFASQVRE